MERFVHCERQSFPGSRSVIDRYRQEATKAHVSLILDPDFIQGQDNQVERKVARERKGMVEYSRTEDEIFQWNRDVVRPVRQRISSASREGCQSAPDRLSTCNTDQRAHALCRPRAPGLCHRLRLPPNDGMFAGGWESRPRLALVDRRKRQAISVANEKRSVFPKCQVWADCHARSRGVHSSAKPVCTRERSLLTR